MISILLGMIKRKSFTYCLILIDWVFVLCDQSVSFIIAIKQDSPVFNYLLAVIAASLIIVYTLWKKDYFLKTQKLI